MPATKVLILTALRIEAGHVGAALGMRVPRPGEASARLVSGARIDLRLVGMGALHLPTLDAQTYDYVILAGFAGGLSRELHAGDVVIDAGANACELPAGCRRGTIHFSERAVTSAREKASLFESTQCVAVDMESGPVRHWASQQRVPLVVIRAISDEAAEPLVEELLSLVDSYGSPRVGRMLAAIARRPGLLPGLVKLGRSARQAGKNLGRAVHQFIELCRNE